MNTTEIYQHILKNGGITIDPLTNDRALSLRYVYSLDGYEQIVQCGDELGFYETWEDATTLAIENGTNVGAWVDNGIIYIDLSVSVASFEQAVKEGLRNRQLSIYDTVEDEVIWLDADIKVALRPPHEAYAGGKENFYSLV